ncbi:uncharacterized protein LOC106665292 [Cimex lectularius]|uniref:Carboxyl esterase n=1 Tax=Cimex lectularius TaxID=79782 RepID=A0A8I6SQF2_CIMLE|nr:uncharacterized protein LOC106665292 [Cimex lectularius]
MKNFCLFLLLSMLNLEEGLAGQDEGSNVVNALPHNEVFQKLFKLLEGCGLDEQAGLRKVYLKGTATCNDGSPAGYYIRRSSGSKRWIVFLEGGWYCYDKRSCNTRWHRMQHLMSSKKWQAVKNVGGILSTKAEENPYWWNANHVFVPYCTSDSWSGRRAVPVLDTPFTFMGAAIVEQVISELLPLGLQNANSLLLAGSSAGGAGVMLNLEHVQTLLYPYPNIIVRGITDSGWFLDRAPYSHYSESLASVEAIKKGLNLWDGQMPKTCKAKYKHEPWRCFFGYRLYPTLLTPLFVFQWLFDEAQMTADNVGAPMTKQQWDYVHKMGDSLRTSFRNVTSVFAPSCISHSILTKRDWHLLKIDDVSLPQALRCWEINTNFKNNGISPVRGLRRKNGGGKGNHLSNSTHMVGQHKKKRRKNGLKIRTKKNKRGGARRNGQKFGLHNDSCKMRLIERCSWPQCNHSCPKLHNPFTGEEMDFIELLKSFGLDMTSVANALGIDIHTLNNMDQEELLNLLTQQAKCMRPSRPIGQYKCRRKGDKMWYFLVFPLFQYVNGHEQLVGISPLYLTVSSLLRDTNQGTKLIERELQINWESDAFDAIAVYRENPNVEPSDKIFQISTLGISDGLVETNVTLGKPVFPNGWDMNSDSPPIPGDHCLPFWVVGFKQHKIITADCIKIRPTWMQDNRLVIRNLPITSLFIPGTHNSGCYKRGSLFSQRRDTTGKYILTQDQSIWNQLVYGIRYLDFRIGYYPVKNATSETSDNCFWINHDLIKVRHMTPILRELKGFLAKAKDEIVILDLHRFPIGFNNRPQRHEQLVKYLERELKPIAIPFKSPSVTLDEIWEGEQRLIISYGEKEVQKKHNWLWPPIRQLWGNKQTVEKLYNFLDNIMTNDSVRIPSKGMWAAMAQLTPGPLDLLFNPKGSLREMAHLVNPSLSKWCRKKWWNMANIVTSDFFLETDIINTAIAANVQQGSGPQEYTTF